MWRYTSYLKKGLSHEKTGTECQDSVIVKEDEVCIVAALADGLGSLKHSNIAATTATRAIWKLFASWGAKKIEMNSDEAKQLFAQNLIQEISKQIYEKAACMGVEPSDMDCTLVFVYISKVYNYAITGRLGDSAICIIKSDGSIAINDSNQSANGTCAILDNDAHAHMEISIWDIAAEKIYGFILTSDGLDNEIYRKGSLHVNKAAEDYFNSVAISSEPAQIIQRKVAELTAEENSSFDDDISIAVISRAKKALTFPDDPTWLCTCRARNRLQDTYCYECGKDFSVLYQNIRFREHGGKTAFFMEINRHPNKEQKLIGLPVEPPILKPEPEPEPKPNPHPAIIIPEKKVLNNYKVVLVAIMGLFCLVVGLATGSFFTKNRLNKDVQEMSAQIDILTETIRQISEKNDSLMIVEKDNSELIAPTKKQNDNEIPGDILIGETGTFYWGNIKDDLPNGQGIYLQEGYYFVGQFVDGKKEGTFLIIPQSDLLQATIAVFEDNKIVSGEEPLDKYVVQYSSLNVRKQAGIEHDIVAELVHGDIVYKTSNPPIRYNDKEWIEIIGDGFIGWVVIDGVVPVE